MINLPSLKSEEAILTTKKYSRSPIICAVLEEKERWAGGNTLVILCCYTSNLCSDFIKRWLYFKNTIGHISNTFCVLEILLQAD